MSIEQEFADKEVSYNEARFEDVRSSEGGKI